MTDERDLQLLHFSTTPLHGCFLHLKKRRVLVRSLSELRETQMMINSRRRLIRASEIAEYTFCARAWRLRIDGHEATSGHGARRAGREWHLKHGRNIRRARRLRLIALSSGLLATAAALLLLLFWWRG